MVVLPQANGMSAPDNNQPRPETWRDWLWQFESSAAGIILLPILIVAVLSGMLLPALSKAKAHQEKRSVIAYIAQDQVFAEPLLAGFTKETGVRVKAVFDSETVKTVGLANRLLAERSRPQCDVFWGNEELRTRQLAAEAVWRETNGWAAMGFRSRRIVVNTNFVRWGEFAANATLPQPPRSLQELTNAAWRGRVALAYPLFGTTATHFLALRQYWGKQPWETWCRALVANQPFVVDGNSVVAKLVARGEAWVGLTDSDDIAALQKEGAPVAALPLDRESLLIPNTVAVTRGAPHAGNAEKLFLWLQRPDVLGRLVNAGALEGGLPEQAGVRTLDPDWSGLLAGLPEGTATLKAIFLR
jgi:iron(III) transport system substrate-binding protein